MYPHRCLLKLIFEMPEAEAFCLLVRLMKGYQLRQLFCPEMPGLHLHLHQYDRLVEDHLPAVHVHLARQGLRSHMYATQWFLTFFAYKFPMSLVLRIFDIVIAEGLEAILRFGVAGMKKNAEAILELEFEKCLDFLQNGLFDVYKVFDSLKLSRINGRCQAVAQCRRRFWVGLNLDIVPTISLLTHTPLS